MGAKGSKRKQDRSETSTSASNSDNCEALDDVEAVNGKAPHSGTELEKLDLILKLVQSLHHF